MHPCGLQAQKWSLEGLPWNSSETQGLNNGKELQQGLPAYAGHLRPLLHLNVPQGLCPEYVVLAVSVWRGGAFKK